MAIESRKTQQGFTVLDETIKTYLCRRYGLDEYLERHREKIYKAICNLFLIEMRLLEEDKSDFSEEEREVIFRKWKAEWERYCNGAGSGKAEEVPAMTPEEEQEAARKLVMELPCDMAKLGSEIANRRNAMNHFGYSNINRFGCRGLYEDLKAYYRQFREMTAMLEADEEEQDGAGEAKEESIDSDAGDGEEASQRRYSGI